MNRFNRYGEIISDGIIDIEQAPQRYQIQRYYQPQVFVDNADNADNVDNVDNHEEVISLFITIKNFVLFLTIASIFVFIGWFLSDKKMTRQTDYSNTVTSRHFQSVLDDEKDTTDMPSELSSTESSTSQNNDSYNNDSYNIEQELETSKSKELNLQTQENVESDATPTIEQTPSYSFSNTRDFYKDTVSYQESIPKTFKQAKSQSSYIEKPTYKSQLDVYNEENALQALIRAFESGRIERR